jgi:phospholipase/carboxylesterase
MTDLCFLPANGRPPRALAIVLHGVGGDPSSMEPLARRLTNGMTDLAVVIPQAPFAFDLGGAGFQWFSVRGVTLANRKGRIEAVLPWVQTLVSREASRYSLPLSKVGVCGFSQGAIMALALADQPAPPVAIASIAGRIARAPNAALTSPPRILLTHGTADQTVPFDCLGEAERAFKAASFPVTILPVQAQGHQIGWAQGDAITAFFANVFEMEPAEALL